MKRELLLFVCLAQVAYAPSASALDCNLNGIEDSIDLLNATSSDCNQNQIPDECDVQPQGFARGTIYEFPLLERPQPLFPLGVADFNGDDLPDLWGRGAAPGFSFQSPDPIFVAINRDNSSFETPQIWSFYNQGEVEDFYQRLEDVQAADFDGDGDIDLLVELARRSEQHDVWIINNERAGSFSVHRTNIMDIIFPIATTSLRLTPADFFGNGMVDLAGQYLQGLYAFRRTAPYTYQIATTVPTWVMDGYLSYWSAPGIAIAFSHSPAAVSSAIIRSPGRQLQTFEYPAGIPNAARVIQLRRGSTSKSELISLSADQFGNGKGVLISQPFNPPLKFLRAPVPAGLSHATGLVTAADIDGNGAADLIFAEASSHADLIVLDPLSRSPKNLLITKPVQSAELFALDDFNRDGKADLIYRTIAKALIVLNAGPRRYRSAAFTDQDGNTIPDICERAVPLDFNGDRQSDLVTVSARGSSLRWRFAPIGLNQPGRLRGSSLGIPGDIILAGDFSGHGKVEPGVVRNVNGALIWRTKSTEVQFGTAGDLPLAGYFDSDRKEDRAVVREIEGKLYWFFLRSIPADSVLTFQWGQTGDLPFVGDINRDGIDEAILARRLNGIIVWFNLTLTGEVGLHSYFGLETDTPLPPADRDGDGTVEYVVARGNGTRAGVVSTYEIAEPTTGARGFFYLANLTGRRSEVVSVEAMPGRSDLKHQFTYFAQQSTRLFGRDGDIVLGRDGKAAAAVSP